MSWSKLPAMLILSASLLFVATPSYAGLVIGGWDASRNSTYGIEGNGSAELDSDLAANFPSATITSTGTLTPSYLSTINILVISDDAGNGSATTALSASEQSALVNFVKSGGSAIITVVNDRYPSVINNSYVSPFGLHVTGTLGGNQIADATSTSGPILNGPFGLVSAVDSFYPGFFDSLGSSAISLATLSNNMPLVAEIAPGSLGIGSGGVLLASDSILTDGTFVANDNATLFNNAIAAFSPSLSAVPEPTGLLLLGSGMITAMAIARCRGWSLHRHREKCPACQPLLAKSHRCH